MKKKSRLPMPLRLMVLAVLLPTLANGPSASALEDFNHLRRHLKSSHGARTGACRISLMMWYGYGFIVSWRGLGWREFLSTIYSQIALLSLIKQEDRVVVSWSRPKCWDADRRGPLLRLERLARQRRRARQVALWPAIARQGCSS